MQYWIKKIRTAAAKSDKIIWNQKIAIVNFVDPVLQEWHQNQMQLAWFISKESKDQRSYAVENETNKIITK